MGFLCRAFYILLCFSSFSHVIAGRHDTLTTKDLSENIPLWEMSKGAFLSNLSADPHVALSDNAWQAIGAPAPPVEKGYYWLRFSIRNELPDSSYFDFVAIGADSIVLYTLTDGTPERTQVTGNFVPPRNWTFEEYPELTYRLLAPGETAEVLISLTRVRAGKFAPGQFYVQSRFTTLSEVVGGYRTYTARTEFNGFFLGAVTVMMFFFLFLYFRMDERALLFYSLYLFGAACYSLVVKSLPYSNLARIAYLDYPLTYKLGEPIQYFFFAAYAWFARHLLDIDRLYGLLYHFIKVLTILLTCAGLILLTLNLTNFSYLLQEKAFVAIRLLLLPVAVTLVIWVSVSVKSPVKWFFIVGSSFFITGGLIAFLVDPKSRHLFFGVTQINPIVSFKTGILLESLSFALALGYKLRLVRKEKERSSQALIQQVELNRRLIATENERLEKMVTARTDEIVEKNRLLEIQRQQQLKSDFDKQLAEMEMQALRSQMNPHFIFNSLNSIRHQILTKNYQNASDYLMRFARLLRQILQSSREHVIPLSEELDTIGLYLQLEKLRFGDLFEYTITVDPDMDVESIEVPSMLLQPFVENALKHGIAASERLPRKIDIRVFETPQGYRYEIEDNGIGRKAAQNRVAKGDKAGLGLKITGERVALFNTNYMQKLTVNFEDLTEADELPTGTRVVIMHQDESYKKT